MKKAFDVFQEQGISEVKVDYNWNEIMMMPKLVCYDKNTWKTLQQLANWNREWTSIFRSCYSIQDVEARITCSWADEAFIKAFLEGLAALPNIHRVRIQVSAKSPEVGKMLEAFEKAGIFPQFEAQFTPYHD